MISMWVMCLCKESCSSSQMGQQGVCNGVVLTGMSAESSCKHSPQPPPPHVARSIRPRPAAAQRPSRRKLHLAAKGSARILSRTGSDRQKKKKNVEMSPKHGLNTASLDFLWPYPKQARLYKHRWVGGICSKAELTAAD